MTKSLHPDAYEELTKLLVAALKEALSVKTLHTYAKQDSAFFKLCILSNCY